MKHEMINQRAKFRSYTDKSDLLMEAREKQLKRENMIINLKQRQESYSMWGNWSTIPDEGKGSTNICPFPGVLTCTGSDQMGALPKLHSQWP